MESSTPEQLIKAATDVWPEVADRPYDGIHKGADYVFIRLLEGSLHLRKVYMESGYQASWVFIDSSPSQTVRALTPIEACRKLKQAMTNQSIRRNNVSK